MAKEANVKIVAKEKITAGLVTIKIIGDVAAVKSAVEAGAAAAQKVGQLISTHVIPNPHSDLSFIISPDLNENYKNFHDTNIEQDEHVEQNSHHEYEMENPVESITAEPKVKIKKSPVRMKNVIEENKTVVGETKDIETEEQNLFSNTSASDHLQKLKQEAKLELTKEITADDSTNDFLNSGKKEVSESEKPVISSLSEIENFGVLQLRHLARSFENFPIKGRKISMANRNELYNYFKQILK